LFRVGVARGLHAVALATVATGCAQLGTFVNPTSHTVEVAAVPAGQRPVPYPVTESADFRRAVEAGTRTRIGYPGERYWIQRTDYRFQAELEPVRRLLTGRGTITYHNRSPDTLGRLALQLHQNLFAPTAMRNRVVPLTGGMTLTRVTAQGRQLSLTPAADTASVGFSVSGTIAWVRLPAPLAPGESAELEVAWSFEVPEDGAPRGGTDDEVFFISYWYPQMAVYDDISGWHTDQYMGNAEFHMGFGDYDVSITVPEGWLVAATGELRNPDEVLSLEMQRRLSQSRTSGGIVNIVTAGDRGPGRATAPSQNRKHTWRYFANNVRDFAWGTSASYLWDAGIAVVGGEREDATGAMVRATPDTAEIHAFYRPEKVQWAWNESARYVSHSVDFLSRYLWPYPYPHMTIVDGPMSCGGMEYPMITCIGGQRDTLSLYSVTVHEVAHMWFPMLAASDEKRHSWQDEGLTRFNQAQAMREFFNGYDLETIARERYLAFARTGNEVPLMRHGDQYPMGTPAFGVASYDKPAAILTALRSILGESTFNRAYREYGRRWTGRHPTPWDLWNTIENVSDRDLSWFWRTWFFETWTMDHAVAEVVPSGARTIIVIEDLGLAPMPVRVNVTYAGGTVERYEIPVETWLAGARRYELPLPTRGGIQRVELDPDRVFPDIDRTNDVWPR
jgi:hypothetical protein